MKDRVPLYPGRVKLVPVSGQKNVYDMTRADQPTQQGDPLNKATLLKDATAALFGLGTDAVPDDVLAYVGKYAQHWWRRRTSKKYREVKGEQVRLIIWQGTTSSTTSFNHYSDSLSISQSDGSFSLASDTTLSLSVSTYQNANTLRGKYFYCTVSNFQNTTEYVTQNKIYFVPAGANAQVTSSGSVRYISIECQEVSTEESYGEWEYVQSSSRSAYPDSGEKDGYEYQYLGIPFDNAATAPKIATGSYVGTGKYGESNPNSLTFEFEPKLVMITADDGSAGRGIYWFHGATYSNFYFNNSDGYKATWSVNGNTVSYYASDPLYQANQSKKTYHYLAIG